MKSILLTLSPRVPLRIPFAHFKALQGAAYKLMSSEPSLSAEIHDRRYPDQKAFKFFCFSDLVGRYSVSGKELVYKKRFTWELRSADDRIVDAAERSVRADPLLTLFGQTCDIESYEIRRKRFCADSMDVTMNTPITVYHTEESGFVRYFHPFEDEFFDRLVKNIKNKYEQFYARPLPCEVKIICKAPSDQDKCVTHYENSVITAWYGGYRITAPSEVLDFIYYTGLGGKNSMGFGTFTETP